jgi:hypothetical protein
MPRYLSEANSEIVFPIQFNVTSLMISLEFWILNQKKTNFTRFLSTENNPSAGVVLESNSESRSSCYLNDYLAARSQQERCGGTDLGIIMLMLYLKVPVSSLSEPSSYLESSKTRLILASQIYDLEQCWIF